MEELFWEVVMPVPLPAHVQVALEEVLLERLVVGARGPTLRFWEWSQRALVLGSHQVLANEVDQEVARELDFTVTRRLSGGGTMVLEPQRSITYSLYAPDRLVAGLSFVESFAFLDGWVVACLQALGAPASHRPINDIVSPEGKIGGAAQARRRGFVVHHTAMAYAMEPSLVPKMLRLGRERLSPRGVRSAEKVVSPLSHWIALTRDQAVEALATCFLEQYPARFGSLTAEELAAAYALAWRKYSRREWIDRLH